MYKNSSSFKLFRSLVLMGAILALCVVVLGAYERGKIVLKSDTTKDRREYPTTELDVSEIKEMWYCRLKLSADFSEPAEVFHRLNNIEGEMTDLRASNAALNATMQQILTRLPAL